MKRTVLTFGLISGAIISAMMLLTIPFIDRIGFDRSTVIGYTSMVLAFLLIYFGVRSYRDNVAGGSIRFGQAFKVGALIGVVSSLCYVATWEVIFFRITPDFTEKYQAYTLERARADGETDAQLAERRADLEEFAEWYQNLVLNAAVTFLEPLPVALIMTLLTAGVLSRRTKGGVATDGMVSDSRSPT